MESVIALRTVLVATDFSDAADVAIRYGRELARRFDASLHVLHVADDVAASAMATPGYVGDFSAYQQSFEQECCAKVTATLTEAERAALRAQCVVVTSSEPAQAILDYAKTNAADLVIVGTHGRSGLGHLIMGSVAETLVRTAACPVLTVRPHERDFVQ
jgi:nucleotide-binding universal stress UspA family protein